MGAVALARPVLDIGLFSDNPAMQRFYTDTIGMPFVEAIEHSPTYREIFYAVNGASLKINYSDEPMAAGTSGYRGLLIAREGVREPETIVDPDGLPVTIVPPGHRGVHQLGIVSVVPDVDAERRFFVEGLGAVEDGDGLRLGDAVLFLQPGATERPGPTWRKGFNYFVVFVADCVGAHQRLLDLGAEHSVQPIRLADRCVFSWLRPPSGNWVELVQYPDTGPLPDVPLAADHWDDITRWREAGVPF
jgi:catechol 2,3-dioxygenase-like lactoylglutathione lyase family enzyme